jgi:hypothetical protein
MNEMLSGLMFLDFNVTTKITIHPGELKFIPSILQGFPLFPVSKICCQYFASCIFIG